MGLVEFLPSVSLVDLEMEKCVSTLGVNSERQTAVGEVCSISIKAAPLGDNTKRCCNTQR